MPCLLRRAFDFSLRRVIFEATFTDYFTLLLLYRWRARRDFANISHFRRHFFTGYNTRHQDDTTYLRLPGAPPGRYRCISHFSSWPLRGCLCASVPRSRISGRRFSSPPVANNASRSARRFKIISIPLPILILFSSRAHAIINTFLRFIFHVLDILIEDRQLFSILYFSISKIINIWYYAFHLHYFLAQFHDGLHMPPQFD